MPIRRTVPTVQLPGNRTAAFRQDPTNPSVRGHCRQDDDSGNLGLLGVPSDNGAPPSGPADNSGGLNPESTDNARR